MVAAKEQITRGPGTLSRRSANPNSTCNKLFFDKERNTRADAGFSIEAKNRSKETNKTLNVAIEVQVHMTTRHPDCR